MRRVEKTKLFHGFIGLEKTFDDGGGGVVRIDQNSEVLMLAGGVGFAGHGASLLGDGSTLLRIMALRHSPSVDPLTWLTHRPV